MITVTQVKIRKTYNGEPLKAVASITINECLAIHELRVIKGSERIFVAMPNRRDECDIFRDIIHPTDADTRRLIEEAVLSAYFEYVGTDNPPEE